MNKLLYFPTRFYPAISGAEFYLQRMAEILSSQFKYVVDIFTSNALDFAALHSPDGKTIQDNDKYFKRVNSLDINRYPIYYNYSLKDKIDVLKNIPAFNSLRLSEGCVKKFLINGPYLDEVIQDLINSNIKNYDLIHTTFFPYFNLIISLMLGKHLGIPVICTPFFHYSNPRYSDPLLYEVLRKFDMVIACTFLEREYLMTEVGIPEQKIKVISMGVDYRKYQIGTSNKTREIRFKSVFFNKNEKNYRMALFVGYKNHEKGALSILKAIPFVLETLKDIYFVFIGPSTIAFNRELSKVNKLNHARIINLTPDNLTGYFDKNKIAAFQETDVFVMPSRSDAFGIAFLEAWAAGKPVIGANIGATPEVIQNNVDGMLVEFDNYRDLANTMIKILENRKLALKLGEKGQQKVVLNYSWEMKAKETHELYQEIL